MADAWLSVTEFPTILKMLLDDASFAVILPASNNPLVSCNGLRYSLTRIVTL